MIYGEIKINSRIRIRQLFVNDGRRFTVVVGFFTYFSDIVISVILVIFKISVSSTIKAYKLIM